MKEILQNSPLRNPLEVPYINHSEVPLKKSAIIRPPKGNLQRLP
jgi:hypothetical protein